MARIATDLDWSVPPFGFELGGSEHTPAIQPKDGRVTGRTRGHSYSVGRHPKLFQEFAKTKNSEQSILRFANQYGALRSMWVYRLESGPSLANGNETLAEWRRAVAVMNSTWTLYKLWKASARVDGRLRVQEKLRNRFILGVAPAGTGPLEPTEPVPIITELGCPEAESVIPINEAIPSTEQELRTNESGGPYISRIERQVVDDKGKVKLRVARELARRQLQRRLRVGGVASAEGHIGVAAGAWQPVFRPNSLFDAMLYQLFLSIQELADISVCLGCGELFEVDWPTKEYCSKVCGNNHRRRGRPDKPGRAKPGSRKRVRK